MSDFEENKKGFVSDVIGFSRSVTPLPVERQRGSNDDSFVIWGEWNLYPNFLLKLFSEVPLHRSITESKVNYIMGDGLVTKTDGKKAAFEVNPVDSLEEVVRKLVIDYLIFNYFVIEVQYNVYGKPIYFNHLPAHQLRTNRPKTKFWICQDWAAPKKNILTYDRWLKGQNTDGKSKIFMYSKYVPSANLVYPDVAYSAAIESMVTETLINQFNKNNLEDGFSPSVLIQMFRGIPTPEVAKQIKQKFEASNSGVNGARFIINHNDVGAEKGMQIDTIQPSDYADKLVEVNKKIETNILTVHQATSRLLFGIETEGSLGGNGTEIEKAYQIFKSVFVKDNRNVIESGLNKIFSDAGFPEVEFKDKTNLLNLALDDATRAQVLTIDELRAIDGRPVLPNGEGAKLLTKVSTPNYTSTSTGNTSNVFSNDPYKNGRVLTGEDFEHVKHLGSHKSGYTVLSTNDFHYHSSHDFKKLELRFDDDADIENYLIKQRINGKDLSEIKADIKKELGITISTDDLIERINKLSDAKLIKSEVVDGKITTSPVNPENSRTVQVMYEYKVKDGYGEPLISTSRAFCVRLIENDRLYTRADIQSMSSIFGYDVFKHSGGWYFNPNTQQSENQCRHFWSMVRVIKKGDSK